MTTATRYKFRVRIKVPARTRLGINDAMVELQRLGDESSIELRSLETDKPIRDSGELVMIGRTFTTEQAAADAARGSRASLLRSLATLHVGADFGDRAGKSAFYKAGLTRLQKEVGHPVRNDVFGTMILPDDDNAMFAAPGSLNITVTPDCSNLPSLFQGLLDIEQPLSQDRAIAFDLYTMSMSVTSQDARFMLLMMAMEQIVEQRRRPEQLQTIIDQAVQDTRALAIDDSERESMLGGLNQLRSESISRAGQRLVAQLEPRRYQDKSPAKFFADCYEVRSALVHGHTPLPDREQVNLLGANLERMVAELIAREDDINGETLT